MDITSTRLEKEKILENVNLLAKKISQLNYVKSCVAKETLELSYVRFIIYFEDGSQKSFKECIFSLTERKLESIYNNLDNPEDCINCGS